MIGTIRGAYTIFFVRRDIKLMQLITSVFGWCVAIKEGSNRELIGFKDNLKFDIR